ncbi:MAG: YceI family protein [Myxococcaceae bacterium]|jgi:polyisoprenoid-binding protein YceI|nr:YceI family protein [Myxococcaceae bacterium]
MRHLAVLSALVSLSALAAPWEIDTSHASATFSVKHFGVSNVNGTLGPVTGMVELDDADPSKGKIDATIDVKAIDTKWAKRDEHLRSPDFFEVDKFPTMTFKSTKITKVSKTKLKIVGDLTIHGVTKPVTLDAEVTPEIKNPFSGNPTRAVTASAVLNRQDFGLKWQAPAEAVKVVGDEVKVAIELELVQKPAAK